jgi:hypothetical protein
MPGCRRRLRSRSADVSEFRAPTGLDARTVTAESSGALGVYLAKLVLEVTGGMAETGRRTGSRTMWQVLADGLATGVRTIWRRGPNTSRAATTESRPGSPVGCGDGTGWRRRRAMRRSRRRILAPMI